MDNESRLLAQGALAAGEVDLTKVVIGPRGTAPTSTTCAGSPTGAACSGWTGSGWTSCCRSSSGWTPVAPRWHYNHVTDDVLPALRERGVTGEQITTMLVDNPRRCFEVEA